MSDFAVQVRGLGYRDGVRRVFDGLSIDVRRGEAVAIVGPVGAGKTRLLRIMAGLATADEGDVRVLGQDPRALDYAGDRALRLRVAFVFESTGLLANLTLGENIALPLRYHRERELGADGVVLRVHAVASELGIAASLRQTTSSAHASLVKRALYARALATEPELLLVDEPQSGLTPHEAARVAAAIAKRRSSRAMAVVYADLDAALAPFLVDRALYLDRGVLTDDAPPRSFRPTSVPPPPSSLSLDDIYRRSES